MWICRPKFVGNVVLKSIRIGELISLLKTAREFAICFVKELIAPLSSASLFLNLNLPALIGNNLGFAPISDYLACNAHA
jgi:hypothetical protein